MPTGRFDMGKIQPRGRKNHSGLTRYILWLRSPVYDTRGEKAPLLAWRGANSDWTA